MSCDVGEATEGLENERAVDEATEGMVYELSLRFSDGRGLENEALLVLQVSVSSPTSILILQPFCRFTYVTCTSSTSPGEAPM